MTKYTAIFKDGTEKAYTSEEFKNRLEVYGYICKNKMIKEHGGLVEITVAAFGK